MSITNTEIQQRMLMGKTKTDKNPKHSAHFLNKIKVCCDSGCKKTKSLNINLLLIYKNTALDWIKFYLPYFISTNPLQIKAGGKSDIFKEFKSRLSFPLIKKSSMFKKIDTFD